MGRRKGRGEMMSIKTTKLFEQSIEKLECGDIGLT